MIVDLNEAFAECDKLGEVWRLEKQVLDESLQFAVKNKMPLPDGYWKAEYTARMKFQAAVRVVEALQGIEQ